MFQLIRLKEGANINKSLTTLGKVISALAEVVRKLFILRFHFIFDFMNTFSPPQKTKSQRRQNLFLIATLC